MWYFIRLTVDTTLESLSSLFSPVFLISKEFSKRGREHFHIVHSSEKTKDEMKELIYNRFSSAPKGNRTLRIDLVGDSLNDWEQVSTYTVKDGEFIHSVEFDAYIERFVANSFQKKTYTEELKEMKDSLFDKQYLPAGLNWVEVKRDIARLKARYGHEVYPYKIEALVLSWQIDLNPAKANELFS